MGTVLVVSSSEKATDVLAGFLKAERGTRVVCVASGAEARRLPPPPELDVVLINTPLKDEFGDELAVDLLRRTAACPILIVKGEHADEVAGRVEQEGVLVLPTPISKPILFGTVKLARVTHNQMAVLRAQNDKLQKRLEELRLVDRAKCALIQYRGLTEPEAHKFIEREAMDGRITRKQVAEELLRTFEGAL